MLLYFHKKLARELGYERFSYELQRLAYLVKAKRGSQFSCALLVQVSVGFWGQERHGAVLPIGYYCHNLSGVIFFGGPEGCL